MAKGLAVVSGSNNVVHKFTEDGTAFISGSLTVTGSSYLQEVSGTTAQFVSYTGNGANITNITASNIDNFTTDVRSQFTAGTDISIVNGVISSTAAGSQAKGPEYAIQFNSGSTFSGSANLLFDYDNSSLSLSGTLNITGSIVPEGDGNWSVGSETSRLADLHAVQVTAGAYFESGLETPGIGDNPTGTVLCWHKGKLHPSKKANDNLVMGVALNGKDQPIIMGAEYILVTGEVKEGDFLVTSNKKGHAMSLRFSASFLDKPYGIIIAQALENCNGESNLIKSLINKM